MYGVPTLSSRQPRAKSTEAMKAQVKVKDKSRHAFIDKVKVRLVCLTRPTGVNRGGTHADFRLIPIDGAEVWEAALGCSA
jgi:hypothetical protein